MTPRGRRFARVVAFLGLLSAGLPLAEPAGAAPADGALDPSFGSSGARVFAWNQGGLLSDWVRDVAADANGHLFLMGSFDSSFGDDDWGIAELDATGTFVNSQYLVFDLGGPNTDVATSVRLDGAGGWLIAAKRAPRPGLSCACVGSRPAISPLISRSVAAAARPTRT